MQNLRVITDNRARVSMATHCKGAIAFREKVEKDEIVSARLTYGVDKLMKKVLLFGTTAVAVSLSGVSFAADMPAAAAPPPPPAPVLNPVAAIVTPLLTPVGQVVDGVVQPIVVTPVNAVAAILMPPPPPSPVAPAPVHHRRHHHHSA